MIYLEVNLKLSNTINFEIKKYNFIFVILATIHIITPIPIPVIIPVIIPVTTPGDLFDNRGLISNNKETTKKETF